MNNKPLVELSPVWIAARVARHGMGISFACPAHRDCSVEAWFEEPFDLDSPITLTEHRTSLFKRYGDSFDHLSISPPIPHREAVIVVFEGAVNMVEL